MAKARKKTVKRKPLKLKFDNAWVLAKIDEDGDYECGCGTETDDMMIKEIIKKIMSRPTSRQVNYAGHVERLVRVGECGDLTNYAYHYRVKNALKAIRHWWSL